MRRIRKNELEILVSRLNEIMEMPAKPWSKGADGKLRANVGNYHLDQAYSGVKLVQMQNEGGGIRDVLSMGYESKRDAYNQIQAYLRGLTERFSA